LKTDLFDAFVPGHCATGGSLLSPHSLEYCIKYSEAQASHLQPVCARIAEMLRDRTFSNQSLNQTSSRGSVTKSKIPQSDDQYILLDGQSKSSEKPPEDHSKAVAASKIHSGLGTTLFA